MWTKEVHGMEKNILNQVASRILKNFEVSPYQLYQLKRTNSPKTTDDTDGHMFL